MSCPEYESFAEYYDYVLPYRTRDDVGFYVELAREANGPVLELACGTGRVLIPTARAGVETVGIDIAPAMLDVCRRKLADEPEAVRARVTVRDGDMRRFHLGRQFALVTIPFRGFQHLLTVDDQLAALQAVHRHVSTGGRFVLDLFNPSVPLLGDARWLVHPMVEPPFLMPDGRRVVRSYRILGRDFLNQTQHIEFVHDVRWPDGREERRAESFHLRYLFRFEAEHLLVRSGFAIEALYSGYDRSAYGSQYPGELIFVTRKQ